MAGWLEWLIAACALAAGELITTRSLLGPFALGALLAAAVDVAGGGSVAAWVAFVVVSPLSLLLVRLLLRSRRRRAREAKAGDAALIGEPAVVLETIANREGMGCVTVGGEVWNARALAGDRVIERGTQVRVVEIKGTTALVRERGERARS